MFGKIKFIADNTAHVETVSSAEELGDLMNIHVVFEAPDQLILGEVEEVNDQVIKIRFLGEFHDGKYVSGVIRKPVLSSKIRMINDQELKAIVGEYNSTTFKLGRSSIYKDYDVCVDINNLFANHMAVFGNTGSGKSCGVARVVQNIFSNPNLVSYNASIFIFDAYGEYKTAFCKLNELNPNYSYKFVTTNVQESTDYELHIPFHLLTLDDLTIMLQVDKHSQIPILERSLKLTKIFSQNDDVAEKYKNHLIAKALIAILYSNQITANKKNEIFKVLEVCHTGEFNFDSVIQGIGYTRTLSECFEIDSNGNFGESVLITEYILKHIDEELEMTAEPQNPFYTLRDFAQALEFTLISEGFQDNDQLYDDSMLLKVRLEAIINSKLANIYKVDNYITVDKYIASLMTIGGKKAQIINMNLEDIDDTHSKIIVKIMARLFFDFCKTMKERATLPIHLFLEEAHRYVQKDADVFLIGYNIFDRIAKEGRKYGVLLNIISQRPVEISETVIAQCSNFLIFKMTHPRDIEYIRTMLPNISSDVIEKQKILQPGNCVGFGGAFKLPMVVKLEMPNPAPNSNSCDVNNCWKMENVSTLSFDEQDLNEGIIQNEDEGDLFKNDPLLRSENPDAVKNSSFIDLPLQPASFSSSSVDPNNTLLPPDPNYNNSQGNPLLNNPIVNNSNQFVDTYLSSPSQPVNSTVNNTVQNVNDVANNNSTPQFFDNATNQVNANSQPVNVPNNGIIGGQVANMNNGVNNQFITPGGGNQGGGMAGVANVNNVGQVPQKNTFIEANGGVTEQN